MLDCSIEEKDFIASSMALSDNVLLFTKEQFGIFAKALRNQFLENIISHHGIEIDSFSVYPLNSGICIDESIFLELPYISENFKYYKPYYTEHYVEVVNKFWEKIKDGDSKYVLFSLYRSNDLGDYLSCFNYGNKSATISGGRIFHKESARPMTKY